MSPIDATDSRIQRSRLVQDMLILIGLVLSINGCQKTATEPVNAGKHEIPTIRADLHAVQLQTWPRIIRCQGSLMADEVSVVGAKVAGKVAEVHVDLGDYVKAGSPLITLDQEEFRIQVTQAEAQLSQARSAVGLKPDDSVLALEPKNAPPVQQELAIWDEAKANLERAQRLQKQNAFTQAEVEQIAAAERVARARYASALNGVYEKIALIGLRQAELLLARQRLEDIVIRMPFDGLIQQRDVAPGAYVQVGNAVATVVRNDPLRFRGSIPERQAQNLAIGQQVELRIESIAQPLRVKVTRISPALNPSNRSLLFEANVDNRDRLLRAGLFAEAEVFVDPNAQALVVPRSSVIEFAGAEKVWKVVDGLLTDQAVITGMRREQGIEILSGLAAGDRILVDGSTGRVAKIDPASTIEKSKSTEIPKPATQPAETPTAEKQPLKESPATPVVSE